MVGWSTCCGLSRRPVCSYGRSNVWRVPYDPTTLQSAYCNKTWPTFFFPWLGIFLCVVYFFLSPNIFELSTETHEWPFYFLPTHEHCWVRGLFDIQRIFLYIAECSVTVLPATQRKYERGSTVGPTLFLARVLPHLGDSVPNRYIQRR